MSNAYIGEIRMVGFNFAPRGWGLCTGTTLSIQQNTALFSLIGTNFGGNGTTTFQLPNLQGRMAIGFGTGTGLSPYTLGQAGGAQSANILIANMPAHNHGITGAVNVGTYGMLGNQPLPQGHVLALPDTNQTPPAVVKAYSDQTPTGTLGGV